MVKGCKLLVHVASDEVARLKKENGKIKFEVRVYEKDPKTKVYEYKFIEISNEDIATENNFAWYYKLDAQHIQESGTTNKGDADIDYGQRWIVDGDRESERTNPDNDSKAPKRGFIFANSFDTVDLTLNLMMWQEGDISLGNFKSGNYDVIPEIIFRVTVTSGKEQNSFEFPFNPKDPTSKESRFTQTVTYHPWTT